MATKGVVAVVAAETAVMEARAAAAAAVARAVATRAVAWMEEPPEACAGSTPSYGCSGRGMRKMAASFCSRSSSGSCQRTAAYFHTTKAARRSAKRRANSRDRAASTSRPTAPMDPDEPETTAKTAVGSLLQRRKGALSRSHLPRT